MTSKKQVWWVAKDEKGRCHLLFSGCTKKSVIEKLNTYFYFGAGWKVLRKAGWRIVKAGEI